MAYKLRLSKELKADLDEVVDYYKSKKLELNSNFINLFEKKVELIVKKPDAFPTYDGVFRKAILEKYPYSIYFKFYNHTITVVSIIHHSRGEEFIESKLH